MPFKIGGGSGSGGSINVPDSLRFATTINRDDYFTTNPTRLLQDVYCTVGDQLQRYNGSAWENTAVAIKGDSGSDAPPMLIQYSTTGNSNWSNTLNVATHKYWRWSTDNGSTWSANFVKFSGGGTSAGVPEPYSMVVGGNGKLQLYKNGILIQEQDETGSWITNSISTGTGSVHLGDLHSIGSAGENAVFLNTDSQLAWHPCWGAISSDGLTVIEQSARVHSTTLYTVEPVGAVGASIVNYDSTFTVTGNNVFLFLTIKAGETFNGRCWLQVVNQSTGKEICHFPFTANFVAGQESTIPFKYPLWMSLGQVFTTQIRKDDNNFVQVYSNATATHPWRRATYRTFEDRVVFHEGNPKLQASTLNTLTGVDRISAAAIRDFPVMSNSVLGMAKLGATLSVDGNGVLNTAISPTGIKIVANQAARTSLASTGGAILAIQQDTGFTYGIEAGEDTSVNGNWKQIGTVATSVVSFNGRNGAVVPTAGDYNQTQIKTVHDDTSVEGWFGIDNNGIYWTDGL